MIREAKPPRNLVATHTVTIMVERDIDRPCVTAEQTGDDLPGGLLGDIRTLVDRWYEDHWDEIEKDRAAMDDLTAAEAREDEGRGQ